MDVLIAMPRDLLRRGLHTLFAEDRRIAHVYDAATTEELKAQLTFHAPDMVVIHQSLVTDINILPRDHFVILTDKPDLHTLRDALAHGIRGYLLESTSADLLLMALFFGEQSFFLDPSLAPWLSERLSGESLPLVNDIMLTPREWEVFYLLHDCFDDKEIAERLCISHATVRTHVVHILHKLHLTRDQLKRLSLPRDKQKGKDCPSLRSAHRE